MESSQDLFSSFEASLTPHILMRNNIVMTVCGKISIDIYDGTFCYVLCIPSFSSNLFSIYQITHSGSRKIVDFTTDSFVIQDSAIGGLIASRTVDHTTCLYTSHFGPPSPLSKHNSSLSREHHVVQLAHLNLCIVPEITVLTTTPHPVEVFSLQ